MEIFFRVWHEIRGETMPSPTEYSKGAPEGSKGYHQFVSFVNSREPNPRGCDHPAFYRTWQKWLDQYVPGWHDVVARLPDITALNPITTGFPSFGALFAAIFPYLSEHVVDQIPALEGKREQAAVRDILTKRRRLRREILLYMMLMVVYWVTYIILFYINGPSTTALAFGIAVFFVIPGVVLPALWWDWRRMHDLDLIKERVKSKTPLSAIL